MNKVILIGNLAADPEVRETRSGIPMCSFRLAVKRDYTNRNGTAETDFLTVVAWRQLADLCAKYLSKGRCAAIEGSIHTRSYEAQDGSRRTVTEIVADNIEFLSARESAPAAAKAPVPSNAPSFVPYEDDDLPF